MKYKFVLILFSLLFCCTACSINYNIELNESNYYEKIYAIENHIDYFKKNNNSYKNLVGYNKLNVETELDQPQDLDYLKLYNYFNVIESGAYFDGEIRSFAEYNFGLYKCYDDYILENNDNIITLKTSGNFLCDNILSQTDNFYVNIKSDYKLIETNANTVENNVYTWNLKENVDKNIILKLKVENLNNEINENSKNNFIDFKFLTVALFGTILLITFISLFIYIKNKNSNKI